MSENRTQTYDRLQRDLGHEMAEKEVVKWLRDLADAIEQDEMRMVVAASRSELDFSKQVTISVTSSYPMPG